MINPFKALFGSAGEQIDVQDSARRLEAGAVMIDVREANEYAGGHAPAALHLPLSLIRAQGGAAIDALNLPGKTTEILLICQGGMRSGAAQAVLSRDAPRRHINVAGGMAAWIARGLPVSR
jgi:rhodanese-related sulfurtransferase